MASENFTPGQSVRFTGGKYNGFQGTLQWVGDQFANVIVVYEGKPTDMIEDLKFLQDLKQWQLGRSFTELSLKQN